jgi:sucrose-6F-phosphate phosphohydrolase
VKFLLVTDLDHTLVGDAQATLALNQKLAAMRDRLSLIYATGRSYLSARQLKHEAQLLEPDYWITGVGTEIYHQGNRDSVWAQQLSDNWQRDQITALVQGFPDLIPQPDDAQNPWKISYFLHSSTADVILTTLRLQLVEANLPAKIIFSSNRDVDILPLSGDKGLAMTYVRQQLQLPSEAMLVCGDSGNDISLFQHATQGVIVRNAQPELLDWYRRSQQSPQSEFFRHYWAQSAHAWGILEALFYFRWL